MYREIITANSPTFEIRIPEEMRGKKIEIIAFEIENESPVKSELSTKSVSSEDFFTKHRIDLSNFKFNREEANDYE
jgi:hypothetical protein